MRTLATIFGALALMTWGVSAQEGYVPAPAADAQPALAAPAVTLQHEYKRNFMLIQQQI